MSHENNVRLFMEKAGQDLPTRPTIPIASVRELRARLILEEALETIHALGFQVQGLQVADDCKLIENYPCDIMEVVDGCCDIHVVTTGTMLAFGIPQEKPLEAVDQSNFTKSGGYRREDGKWMKPPEWEPPNLAFHCVDEDGTVKVMLDTIDGEPFFEFKILEDVSATYASQQDKKREEMDGS